MVDDTRSFGICRTALVSTSEISHHPMLGISMFYDPIGVNPFIKPNKIPPMCILDELFKALLIWTKLGIVISKPNKEML